MGRRHGEQLSIENDPAYEVEHLSGPLGRPFAVIVQPHEGGAWVTAPRRVETQTWMNNGQIHIHLMFPSPE